MTLQEELGMRQRVEAYWQALGPVEKAARGKLMLQADALTVRIADCILKHGWEKYRKVFDKANCRYKRRALAYYGE